MKKNTAFSYLIILAVYALAVYTGKLTLDYLKMDSIYLEIFIADLTATGIVFVFSMLFRNSSIYDPYWSIIPVPVAMYLIALNPDGNLWRQVIILTILFAWSLRLTVNWVRSWRDLSVEDWRYKKLAEKTGMYYWLVSLFGIHILPTIIVFLGLLPVFVSAGVTEPLGFYDITGAFISLTGIAIEYISDEQLRDFKQFNFIENANMNRGMWAVIRHPNYTGEILFWLGLFVMALSGGIIRNLWTGIGLLSMLLLFRLISIPMMESYLAVRKTGYTLYQKSVPALIPRLIIFSGGKFKRIKIFLS